MSQEDREKLEDFAQGITGEVREKLLAWLSRMEPMDYDAPGSAAREAET